MGEQVAAGSFQLKYSRECFNDRTDIFQKPNRRKPWGCSSVGRAPALQAGGQEFESLDLHWPGSRPPEGMRKEAVRIRTLKTAYRTKQISRHPRPYGPVKAGMYGYKLEDLREILHGSRKVWKWRRPRGATLCAARSSRKEHRVDALALRADERRDKLRKASGRSKYPLIRRSLNGETCLRSPQAA